jgi:hypothetical protein
MVLAPPAIRFARRLDVQARDLVGREVEAVRAEQRGDRGLANRQPLRKVAAVVQRVPEVE